MLLKLAPDPDLAARLSMSKIRAVPAQAHRRNVAARAQQIQAVLRAPALRQPGPVQAAFAAIAASEVRMIAAINTEIAALGQVVADHIGRHRDADIYLSQPGLGVILASQVLGEFGDDPGPLRRCESTQRYAGTSPITRASGTKKVVLARYVRNARLIDATTRWAFGSLRGSPGARAYYDQLRARKIGHRAALRQLANCWVGILHGCLKTQTLYDENTAWAHRNAAAA